MDVSGTVWRILATLALVALNGYFVAAEFAAVGARASRLEALAGQSLIARLCLRIKRRVDLYLNTCQLGITLASLGLGAVTEPAVAAVVSPLLEALGVAHEQVHPISFAIALSISTALHVVVGEVAPKNLAIFHPDRVLWAVAVPLVIFTYALYPLVAVLNTASNVLLRLTGVPIGNDAHGVPHTVEELRTLLAQTARSGTIEKGHQDILTGAFDFGDLKVRQIMTPRTQVDFLTVQQPLKHLLNTIQKSAFTRFPLCDGDVDHVIGLVHMKDLFVHLKLVPGKLRFSDATTPDGEAIAIADGLPGSAVHVIGSGDIDLRKIKRDVMFVPELLPVPKLLAQFQDSRMHLAVVVDEYGATQGIVTLEDVIEEIVGDIEDEFDAVGPSDFVPERDGHRVPGVFPLHELRERLALDGFDPGTDVDTVGGYIIRELGRWPRAGDTVPVGRFTLKVINVQQNRVGHVLVMPTVTTTEPASK